MLAHFQQRRIVTIVFGVLCRRFEQNETVKKLPSANSIIDYVDVIYDLVHAKF